jgi:hypothetical protein
MGNIFQMQKPNLSSYRNAVINEIRMSDIRRKENICLDKCIDKIIFNKYNVRHHLNTIIEQPWKKQWTNETVKYK